MFSKEAIITDPPTSREVFARILSAFERHDQSVKLTLLPTQEVPRPKQERIDFVLRGMLSDPDGSAHATGAWTDSEGQDHFSADIRMASKYSDESATVSLILNPNQAA